MKIIEAIQEAYGPEFTTLEDAINWWSGPRAFRQWHCNMHQFCHLQYSVAGSWTGCGRLCHRPAERADRGGAGHKLE